MIINITAFVIAFIMSIKIKNYIASQWIVLGFLWCANYFYATSRYRKILDYALDSWEEQTNEWQSLLDKLKKLYDK